ncbi:AbrB/MazE/SpoVT family DNA-binding domain-containing protein [Halegenticoccus soli]|uniref:AbrB/MazE/SpoVT family DNA-binding domain-containing protein n=1 Tax=Halegenticoccus soli TaxID=1985678 RepID=UPI000C6CDF3D|nr:AbrB/MazE/SpoVT family DNA-binding domain-containing protein [Halegenticoccus soli]
MSSNPVDAESKVSGNQANIPAHIRRALDIEDGDQLRWVLEDNGTLRVEVIHRRTGTFADFSGYDVDGEPTDVAADHDTWGLE